MTILEFLFSGGIVGNLIIVILGILSIIGVYIFLKKYLQISILGNISTRFEKEIISLLENNQTEDAIDLCDKKTHIFAKVLGKVLRSTDLSSQRTKEHVENSIKRELSALESNIATLASIAGGAPMIGFLGTVIGMIMAFYKISSGGGNVEIEMLSQGIYTAMFTTAVGLVVGIFAYFSYNFLVSKIQKIATKLELEVFDIIEKSLRN